MITKPEEEAAAGRGHYRAASTDREHVIDTLKAAFVQGRLSKDELDARAGQAFTARTYAELAAVTAAIPTGWSGPRTARQRARSRNEITRPRTVQNAAIRSAGCLIFAFLAFLYGVHLDNGNSHSQHFSRLFVYLAFLAAMAVPVIIGRAAVTSWQQRHPARR